MYRGLGEDGGHEVCDVRIFMSLSGQMIGAELRVRTLVARSASSVRVWHDQRCF